MAVDWAEVRRVRASILKSEERLRRLYLDRAALMQDMATDGMSQRQVGAYWGISQVAVLKAMRAHENCEQ